MKVDYREKEPGVVVVEYRRVGRIRPPPRCTERCPVCGKTGVIVGLENGEKLVCAHVADQLRGVVTALEWCPLPEAPAGQQAG